jgi:hypothetical protein
MKKIHIFGGGTVSYIANHFALCAPAYGSSAKKIEKYCEQYYRNTSIPHEIEMHLTRMAGGDTMETAIDIQDRIDRIKQDLINTKVIFFNCAIVDYIPTCVQETYESAEIIVSNPGKLETRLETKVNPNISVVSVASPKIIGKIREDRDDIYVVGFKTTCGIGSKDEMYQKGCELLKKSKCNLVLVNDTKLRVNMIINEKREELFYNTDRELSLGFLTKYALENS